MNALRANHDPDGVIREYKVVIALDPKDAYPHLHLGDVLNAKGVSEGAIAAYREAVRLRCPWAPTYQNLALHLAKRGERFAALQTLRDGLRVDRRFIADFRYNMACFACLVARGQAKGVPSHLDRARLRGEALAWLTDELTTQRKLAGFARNIPVFHKTVLHWLADADLNSVRNVGKLPPEERDRWVRLLAGVRQLRDDTAPLRSRRYRDS